MVEPTVLVIIGKFSYAEGKRVGKRYQKGIQKNKIKLNMFSYINKLEKITRKGPDIKEEL